MVGLFGVRDPGLFIPAPGVNPTTWLVFELRIRGLWCLIDSMACCHCQQLRQKYLKQTWKNEQTLVSVESSRQCEPCAYQFATKVRPLLNGTSGTQRIFEVGVDLNLFGELGSFYLNKGGGNSFEIRACAAECNSGRSDRILVFVRVDTCNQNTTTNSHRILLMVT